MMSVPFMVSAVQVFGMPMLLPQIVPNRLLIALALAVMASSVCAQYQWKDENGRMVFSDLAPPNTIDPSRIVRTTPARNGNPSTSTPGAAPGAVAATPTATAAINPTGGNAGANPSGGRETLADKELDAKRKAKEKADAERKKKEDSEQSAKLARACDEMRTEVRTLESGMRTARINSQGEREFLTDEERERRMDLVRRDIRDTCKPA
jgi:Domain of unknown function (DUF4124)